ncbi:hypothetical protein CFC21_105054 [Triticum aestivum]|uniref:Secreted protein n=3 Tax=Triticum TaxID=4564 RepID=A0A9R1ACP3_TRITD|nr:hypothetical protein CFC21_105054 [Triticum aestivum]VAI92456.1 unnamed protein product [Triticum turgidum subsp. durum]
MNIVEKLIILRVWQCLICCLIERLVPNLHFLRPKPLLEFLAISIVTQEDLFLLVDVSRPTATVPATSAAPTPPSPASTASIATAKELQSTLHSLLWRQFRLPAWSRRGRSFPCPTTSNEAVLLGGPVHRWLHTRHAAAGAGGRDRTRRLG